MAKNVHVRRLNEAVTQERRKLQVSVVLPRPMHSITQFLGSSILPQLLATGRFSSFHSFPLLRDLLSAGCRSHCANADISFLLACLRQTMSLHAQSLEPIPELTSRISIESEPEPVFGVHYMRKRTRSTGRASPQPGHCEVGCSSQLCSGCMTFDLFLRHGVLRTIASS